MTRSVDPVLVEQVRLELARDPGPVTSGRVAAAVRSVGAVLGDLGLLDVTDALKAELVGAGPLEPLLADPLVTDVLVNADRGVWVDRGQGLEQVRLRLGSEADVRRLAVRLAATAGRRLDDACPYVDARLPGGVRLHAVLPPLAQEGTHLSLRVPHRRVLTLDDLGTAGTVPPSWQPILRTVVESRCAFLVTGGTGCGKTTVLGGLLSLVPTCERVVVVEDCSELRVDHPHVVRLESRPPNVEGQGAVTMTDLVRQALRMRPDRLVVGEVRGAEVRELLTALNTGHEGGCGTIHANAAREVPARLEALAALAGLQRDAVAAQAAGAIDLVLHLRRLGGLRRLTEIAVVQRGRTGLEVVPALLAHESDPAADGSRGPGWPALRERLAR
ncbi:MAG TPA: TadA family conjugal transfer-associated ATPase [Actinomycetales bacterium]|nr:TadA family conjugal transfer-associated ATPase [Actinomycetales bacterium]